MIESTVTGLCTRARPVRARGELPDHARVRRLPLVPSSSAAPPATSAADADVPVIDVVRRRGSVTMSTPGAARNVSGPYVLPTRDDRSGRSPTRRRHVRLPRGTSGARSTVAGRRDHDCTLRPRVVDRVLKVGAVPVAGEAHEDDVRVMVRGPHDTLDDVAVLSESVRVEHLHRHDLHVPGRPRVLRSSSTCRVRSDHSSASNLRTRCNHRRRVSRDRTATCRLRCRGSRR